MSLLDHHHGIVVKVASLYCWRAEDRRDLAQEIALQLWRAFPAYDERRPFSTWMYRIALNVAISAARKAARRPQHASLEDHGVDPIDTTSRAEPNDHVVTLYRFMARLDPLNRALLALYLDECSYRQIADVLGITETNVATKISRLKQRIRMETTTWNSTT